MCAVLLFVCLSHPGDQPGHGPVAWPILSCPCVHLVKVPFFLSILVFFHYFVSLLHLEQDQFNDLVIASPKHPHPLMVLNILIFSRFFLFRFCLLVFVVQ